MFLSSGLELPLEDVIRLLKTLLYITAFYAPFRDVELFFSESLLDRQNRAQRFVFYLDGSQGAFSGFGRFGHDQRDRLPHVLNFILGKQGLSRDRLTDDIREGKRVDALIDQITANISDPTEEEIRTHFEAHAGEYRRPDRAQARHILLRVESDRAEDGEVAKSRLLGIRDQIANGAEFADMAAAHSYCPSGKQSGGSLGWFSRGMMVPEFDEAVFALKPGELSEVICTKIGYHLIQKIAEEKGGDAAFADARDKVREFLRHVRRGEAIAAYVEELKEKAVIEED